MRALLVVSLVLTGTSVAGASLWFGDAYLFNGTLGMVYYPVHWAVAIMCTFELTPTFEVRNAIVRLEASALAIIPNLPMAVWVILRQAEQGAIASIEWPMHESDKLLTQRLGSRAGAAFGSGLLCLALSVGAYFIGLWTIVIWTLVVIGLTIIVISIALWAIGRANRSVMA